MISRITLSFFISACRYQELLRNAGAGEGEEFPTTTALFNKVREEDEDEDQDDLEESFLQEEQEDQVEANRLSKQRREKERGAGDVKGREEVVGDGKGSTVVFQHGGSNEGDQRSTAAVAKTASRIALYMMREEMKDTPVESPVQHSHDFFVISSCGVAAKILRKDEQSEEEEEEVVNFHGLNVDKRLLPGDYDANSAVMARYALDPQGKSTRGTQLVQWRSSMVPLTSPNWEQVAEACLEEGWGEGDIAYLQDLVAYVNTFKVMGASKADVRNWRPEQAKGKRLAVSELLSMAIRHFLLIQVGVVEQMYVGHAHSRPWLLHSFKVVRANEELGSLKEAGKLYQGHGPLPPAQDEQQEGGGEGQDGVAMASKSNEREDAMKGKGDNTKVAGEEELGRGKRVMKPSRRRSDDGESVGGQDPDERLPKSRRGSLDDNRGGEDILINPRRKNPQVAASLKIHLKHRDKSVFQQLSTLQVAAKMSREVAEACEKINWAGVEEVGKCLPAFYQKF